MVVYQTLDKHIVELNVDVLVMRTMSIRIRGTAQRAEQNRTEQNRTE